MKFFNLSVFTVFFTFFSNAQIQNESDYVQVLGIVQDAGYPHIGCEKDCCELVKPGDYFVSCIGLVDKANNKRYLFCLLYTSPSPRDAHESRMPSSA